MTTSQPPTCCCCLRSRGESLSACALSQLSVRTPARLCIRDYRSDLVPELPWCSALLKLLTAGFTSTDTLCCYGFYFILFFYSVSVRPEKLCTSVRMKTLWLWIPWTFAQTTSMIAPGFQFHSTHPRGSEVSQMESQKKTRYVEVAISIDFSSLSCV